VALTLNFPWTMRATSPDPSLFPFFGRVTQDTPQVGSRRGRVLLDTKLGGLATREATQALGVWYKVILWFFCSKMEVSLLAKSPASA